MKEKAKEGSVIIRIHAELSGDYYLNRKTMVQSVLDLAKLAEQIVLFAQLVSGAYLRMGEQDFAVICSYEVLSDTTDRFSHFDLLAQVYGGTPYRLAVGIGTGLHFQQALAACMGGGLQPGVSGLRGRSLRRPHPAERADACKAEPV